MSDEETRARFETLETRIAHQERAIEDLNTTVTEQWKHIDGLNKQIVRFARSAAADRGQRAVTGGGRATATALLRRLLVQI